MRILIIGGTGFIGTHLCEQLCKKNAVTVISKYRNQFSNEANNVDYYYEDWRTFDYDVFFANNIFDKIILVGWSGHPRLSNKQPFEHFETNVTPTINIIDKIMKNTQSEVYFLSSYGGLPNLDKGFSRQNVSAYAASKLSVEVHLEAYSKFYNRKSKVFRLSNPYGCYQNFKGSQGVIPIFIHKAICSDYIFVNDAVNQMIEQLLNPNWSGFSIIPIISGKRFSILDILGHIQICIPLINLVPDEFKLKIEEHSKKIERTLPSSDTNKNLNIHIRDMVKWIKKNL
jgi:nucleoside-diphosphate-sugar epimerase